MKKIIFTVVFFAVIIGGFIYVLDTISEKEKAVLSDYKNIKYTINGVEVVLIDGVSETAIASSSAKVITRYFGNEVRKDLDNDGREDVAFILTQTTGGSGTFYYLAGALNKETGYVSVQPTFLGDRIAPQTTKSGPDRSIIVNYADRKPGEPMTERPSLGKSLRLVVDVSSLQFAQLAVDFEGEADPSRMTLGMKAWSWINTTWNDGKNISPKQPGAFSLSFGPDGKFTATTDCNSMGGTYEAEGSSISFSDIYSTKKFCEGSNENDFAGMLKEVNKYKFTSKGELIFELKMDSGTALFK